MAEATRFMELTRMKYIDQAKWYLNGFWESGAEAEAETIWKCAQKCIELDPRKKEGNELDEFQAHKFLESLGETLTVVALREKLRKIDLDLNGKMALLEYLTFKYSKEVSAVVSAPQGGNQKEVDEAASKLQAVQDALAEVSKQLAEQQTALEAQKSSEAEAKRLLNESKSAEAAAKKAADESKKAADISKAAADEANKLLELQKAAEEAVRKAEAELRAALEDLERQETTYKTQIATLEAKSTDANASTVQKSKAINELAQLKGEDPLPLRKAKITQEAAIRKVEKERKAQEAATQKASEAAKTAENKADQALAAAKNAEQKAEEAAAASRSAEDAAEEAKQKTVELEAKTREVENAVRETEARCQEAQDYLEEVKKKGGVAHGAIWWMERELLDAQRFLPKRKQQQK